MTTMHIRIDELDQSQIRQTDTQTLKVINVLTEATRNLFMATMRFYSERPELKMSSSLITTLKTMYSATSDPDASHWIILNLSCDLIGVSEAGRNIDVVDALGRAYKALQGNSTNSKPTRTRTSYRIGDRLSFLEDDVERRGQIVHMTPSRTTARGRQVPPFVYVDCGDGGFPHCVASEQIL